MSAGPVPGLQFPGPALFETSPLAPLFKDPEDILDSLPLRIGESLELLNGEGSRRCTEVRIRSFLAFLPIFPSGLISLALQITKIAQGQTRYSFNP